MSMLEKLAGMAGADLPAAVKSATDGIQALNASLERIAQNSAAIGARLEVQDQNLAGLRTDIARLQHLIIERLPVLAKDTGT